MALAEVASLRSEDPFRKVGAAALDWDNRVIATAYNGLAPGFEAPTGFWDDRDGRQKFMLHAEVNLCSLFKRGEAKIGIEEIYYRDGYEESDAPAIAEVYGIKLEQVGLTSV
jgi:dCMP deaminase